MKNTVTITLLLSGSIFFLSCDKNNTSPEERATIIQATGDINDEVTAFKGLLGPLDTTPGVTGGHREINWDGVPADMLNKPLPEDFFNPTASNAVAANQRGLTYSPGTFVVSNNSFSFVNNESASEFSSFSGNNTFANTKTSQWDVKFQQAGTTQSASVDAFGAVFVDVDEEKSTSMEFFDNNKSLGKFFVSPHDARSNFSFLGIRFTHGERITKVIVKHDGFLEEGIPDVSEGGTRDLIVLDDFIYSEPVAIK